MSRVSLALRITFILGGISIKSEIINKIKVLLSDQLALTLHIVSFSEKKKFLFLIFSIQNVVNLKID